MNKKSAKLIGSIIGVFGFIAIVAGITYAWITWSGTPIPVEGTSKCFNVNYTASRNIGTASVPARLKYLSSHTGGEYAEVSLGIDSSCSGMTGTGKIILNTTSASNTLLGGGLYYTLVSVSNNTETLISEGAVTATGSKTLSSNINVTTTSTTYRIYVWINGAIAGNSYVGETYAGTIGAEVVAR